MKILHTADWHLGNNFHGYDRTMEHRYFFQWLLNTLRKELPDVLIVAGDVFDSPNPSAKAESLYYDFLLDATEAVRGLQIVVISGKHDSAARIDAPAEFLKRHNIYVRGKIKHDENNGSIDFDDLILPLGKRLSDEAEMVCLALPYLRPHDYPMGMSKAEGIQYYIDSMMRALGKTDFKRLPIVATAHFYVSGADICEKEHSERLVVDGSESVPADVVGKGISYVALGHIHRSQKIESKTAEMYYAGSALPMSFTERDYSYGVQMVNISEEGKVEVKHLQYTPLRRLLSIPNGGTATVNEVFEAIKQLPSREKRETNESWPYLEIRLSEKQSESTLLQDVLKVLADKSVNFCRMVREQSAVKLVDFSKNLHPTLQSLSPLDMAHKFYDNCYRTEMPAELDKRFKEAERLSRNSSLKK